MALRDANGDEIVYVRKKPTAEVPTYGPPSPCLANKLYYAIAQGYEECAAPGDAPVEVITVAPEPVGDEAPAASGTATFVEPEPFVAAEVADVEEEPADEKPARRRSGR
jgi:hypothetical protein